MSTRATVPIPPGATIGAPPPGYTIEQPTAWDANGNPVTDTRDNARDIFTQLAAQDQARRNAAGSQNSKDIFDQLAANGGRVPIPAGAQLGQPTAWDVHGNPVAWGPPSGYATEGAQAQPEDKRSFLQIALDNSPSGADPQNPANPTQQGLSQMSPEGRRAAQKQLAVAAGVTAGGTAVAASDIGALASEYAEYGGQVAKDAIGKIPGLLKSAWDWASANPVKAYLLYKVLEQAGVGPSGMKKVLHIASGAGE